MRQCKCIKDPPSILPVNLGGMIGQTYEYHYENKNSAFDYCVNGLPFDIYYNFTKEEFEKYFIDISEKRNEKLDLILE